MSESQHFVRHILCPGDYVRTEYQCRAPENAGCRTRCRACDDEFNEDSCHHGDEAVRYHGKPCNYLAWFDDTPEECYDGEPEAPVRGPDWQPIDVVWDGDHFVWRYTL